MRCDELEQLQGPYIDSELEAGTTLAVQQHLAACPDCARAFAQQQKLQARMTAGLKQGQRTPALWEQVEQAVLAGGAGVPGRRPARRSQPAGWHALLSTLGYRLQAGLHPRWWGKSLGVRRLAALSRRRSGQSEAATALSAAGGDRQPREPKRCRAPLARCDGATARRATALRSGLLETARQTLSAAVGLQPGPGRAWAGLAAVWAIILTLNLATPEADAPPVAWSKALSVSEIRLALARRQLLMTELAPPSEPGPADRPKATPPGPRSEGRSKILNA